MPTIKPAPFPAPDTANILCSALTAFDVAARMKYKNLNLEQAARETIENLTAIGGEGGLIAVDALGNVTLPFNSDGMYRGFITESGEIKIEIYK